VRLSHARHSRRRARGQAGLSLLESVITIALASVVVLTLAGAMFTLVSTSASTNQAQRLQSALTSYTESLKADLIGPSPALGGEVPYRSCSDTSDPDDPSVDPEKLKIRYKNASTWPPAGSSFDGVVEITGVDFWKPQVVGSSIGSFQPTCPEEDGGAQRIWVKVSQGAESVSGQAVVRPEAVRPA
jgi:type II secretory pathway pseudopilin PulG